MDRGFLIVLRPGPLLERYEASDIAIRNAGALAELRAAVPRIDPRRYRGIARDPLDPFVSTDRVELEEWRRGGWFDVDEEARARRRYREIVGEIREDDDLLPSAAAAREVFGLLDEPAAREIVEVRRRGFDPGPATLGFDIGSWGGDRFSTIADMVVTPQWHPPEPEDFGELADRLATLGRDLLFSTERDASDFRAWYLGRPWAEKELREGEIAVIQVDAVESS
jgi:hypothetical protein